MDAKTLTVAQARAVLALYADPPRPIATQGFLRGGAVAVQAVVRHGEALRHFWLINRIGRVRECDCSPYVHVAWAEDGGWVAREQLLALAQQVVAADDSR